MKTILIIILIIIFLAELWVYFRLHGRELRLEQRIQYVESREESAREAMSRNGDTAKDLNEKQKRLEERSEVVERRNVANMMAAAKNVEFADAVRADIAEYKRFKNSIQVHVFYTVSKKDREMYAEDKIPAVVKSRIANKLGHAILRHFPDCMYRGDVDGREVYAVKIFVKTKLEDEK